MDTNLVIPSFPNLALPAPSPVLELLLIVGFFLHVIPMNMMFGCTLLSSAFLFAGRGQPESFSARAGRGLASAIPIFISVAITQGIVPLLFLQVLYGPAYYTSSILIGAPWISILGLLLVAYYMTYAITYKILDKFETDLPSQRLFKASMVMGVVAFIFAVIAFIFSNNMTLMLTPSKWVQLYKHSPSGFNLNLIEPQLLPRYIHFVLAALAIGGLTVGSFGVYFERRERLFSSWLVQMGSKIFAAITLVQFPIGFWFLLSLPVNMKNNLMGRDPAGTVSLAISLAFSVVALIATAIASRRGSTRAFIIGAISGLITILSMIVTRHILRTYALDSLIKARALPVNTQWDLVAILIVCSIALVSYFVWLTKLLWRAYNKPPITNVTAELTEGASV